MPGRLRRRSVLAWPLASLALAAPGKAQGPAAGPAAPRAAARASPADLWFDPTQLPSFTGTVDRYLPNPSGDTDALLFREGPQVVFPPEVADAVRRVAPPGAPLIVWGIRARKAAVITMLAFAARAEDTPGLVERPYWRRFVEDSPAAGERRARLAVSGRVRQPFFSPQGDPLGAILEDGTVVMLPAPPAAADGLQGLLRPGATLAAEGQGVADGDRRALLAERIGEDPQSLRALPPADAGPAAPRAPAPQ